MDVKYHCIKDCSINMNLNSYYFFSGKNYDVRTWKLSKYSYITVNNNFQISASNEFIEENFVLADEESDLLTEVDEMFEEIFFENEM